MAQHIAQILIVVLARREPYPVGEPLCAWHHFP